MPEVNYYKILGISLEGRQPSDVTPEEVKKAYRKAAMDWHPDKIDGALRKAGITDKTLLDAKRAEGEMHLKEINGANDILSDPKKKPDYDRSFKAQQGERKQERQQQEEKNHQNNAQQEPKGNQQNARQENAGQRARSSSQPVFAVEDYIGQDLRGMFGIKRPLGSVSSNEMWGVRKEGSNYIIKVPEHISRDALKTMGINTANVTRGNGSELTIPENEIPSLFRQRSVLYTKLNAAGIAISGNVMPVVDHNSNVIAYSVEVPCDFSRSNLKNSGFNTEVIERNPQPGRPYEPHELVIPIGEVERVTGVKHSRAAYGKQQPHEQQHQTPPKQEAHANAPKSPFEHFESVINQSPLKGRCAFGKLQSGDYVVMPHTDVTKAEKAQLDALLKQNGMTHTSKKNGGFLGVGGKEEWFIPGMEVDRSFVRHNNARAGYQEQEPAGARNRRQGAGLHGDVPNNDPRNAPDGEFGSREDRFNAAREQGNRGRSAPGTGNNKNHAAGNGPTSAANSHTAHTTGSPSGAHSSPTGGQQSHTAPTSETPGPNRYKQAIRPGERLPTPAPSHGMSMHASSGLGFGMGVYGISEKVGADGTYQQDLKAGGVQAVVATTSVAADGVAIIADGASLLKDGSKILGVGAKSIAKKAPIIAVASGVLETSTAIAAHDGHRAAKSAGGAVGGLAAGMLAGAAYGSIVPGAGTIVGAVVGFGIAAAASYFGSEYGGKAVDYVAGDALDKALKSPLSEKEIDKQLTALLPDLEKKGWGKYVGNHDAHLTLDEVKATLKASGVALTALDKDHNGKIGGKEVSDALLPTAQAQVNAAKKSQGAQR